MNNYDVIIIGGGTAGCSCAWNCAKNGLKTLLVEKSGVLGGSMTSGLVVPMMFGGYNQINTEFYDNLVTEMKNFGAQIKFQNNSGWFNPEILKIVLDKMLTDVGVKILFKSCVANTKKSSSYISHAQIISNALSPCNDKIHSHNTKLSTDGILSGYIEAKYFVDATGDGNFSLKNNCENLNKNSEFQPLSLRFLMSGVDVEAFGQWLLQVDNDRNVSPVEVIEGVTHLSTAYTWDSDKHWALAPYVSKAIEENIIKPSDINYFQVFTVAGMPNTIAFNCPRIIQNIENTENFDISEAYIQARSAIYRLSEFCKKYLKGFEKAYISNISDNLGIRVSNRIRGKYIYTVDDIISGREFENPAVISNYPIDVHSAKKDSSILNYGGEYQLPIESLMSFNYDNLYIIGRCLSADFLAQGALRIQSSCFSMGEAVAKHIASII